MVILMIKAPQDREDSAEVLDPEPTKAATAIGGVAQLMVVFVKDVFVRAFLRE